jgi:hypothetical protein
LRFDQPHRHADDATDDLRLAGMGEAPHLAFRERMRNGPQVAVSQLAPAAQKITTKLGEIRSGEAFDLLQLLNTGHAGTLSTIHANSAKQGLARFTSCVLQSGVELPYRAIKTNIGDSLEVLIHVERRPGRRFISEVLELKRYDPDSDAFDYSVVYAREGQE